jgi:dihydrofolate reductase
MADRPDRPARAALESGQGEGTARDGSDARDEEDPDRRAGASGGGGIALAKLIYSAIASLDGYIADEDGKFDWAAPDEEVHRFVNELDRPVGTHLYGRRMYEVMSYWETAYTLADQPPVIQDYAEIWQEADKIVYSKTLETVSSARTRIERNFDPEAVQQMKASAGRDISIGGPDLAAQAIKAGLIDEYHVFVVPYVAGGGTRFLPDNVRLVLELLDERRFGNGVVHLHYRTRA